ncbi:MAG: amidohydrolase [Deltaproteobacteria bacterium]|nr:amidohydrolase [Deltaproteobacteria bacterium]
MDFHVHVGTRHQWTPWVIDFFRENNPGYAGRFVDRITPEGITAYLKEQGVEKAVILSEYAPKATGVVTNEFTTEFCRGRDMLIPFGSVCLYDPVPPAEQAERAVKELGMKGFKMMPTYAHFYPNDPALWPFYETVRDLGAPLLFHTGTSIFKGSLVKYGDPLFLDDVAESFPTLQIVLAHGGRSFWYDRAAWMITRHKNVFIDISGIPAKQLLTHFPKLEKFADRFLFGSDWPGVPDIRSFVDRVTRLPLKAGTIEAILWGNGAGLLGLEN